MTQVFTDADICVIDDAVTIDEQRQISNQLNSATWRYGWPINDAPFARPCWHALTTRRKTSSRQSYPGLEGLSFSTAMCPTAQDRLRSIVIA